MILEDKLGEKVFQAFDIVRSYGEEIMYSQEKKEQAVKELREFLGKQEVEQYIDTIITAELLIKRE